VTRTHKIGQSLTVAVTVDGVRRVLSSVESAALSGLGAAVLLSLSVYLLGRQPGVRSSTDDLTWYSDSGHRFTVFLGLNLAALGVVARLWFMAVIRRRLGEREDQFFGTVFLSSGSRSDCSPSPRRSARFCRRLSCSSETERV
jgi:hypothetical protein